MNQFLGGRLCKGIAGYGTGIAGIQFHADGWGHAAFAVVILTTAQSVAGESDSGTGIHPEMDRVTGRSPFFFAAPVNKIACQGYLSAVT